ncbi:hypothetical protein V8C37DRAFT_33490 [Trichoderma ceciliae]
MYLYKVCAWSPFPVIVPLVHVFLIFMLKSGIPCQNSQRPGRIGLLHPLTLCSTPTCTRQRQSIDPFLHPRLPAPLRGEVRRPTRLQPRLCHRDQGIFRRGMVEREACTLAATRLAWCWHNQYY